MRIFLPGLQISLFLSGRPFSTAEIHGWNITGVYSFERNFVLDSRETSLFTDNGEGDTTPKAAKEQATNKPALNVSRFFFEKSEKHCIENYHSIPWKVTSFFRQLESKFIVSLDSLFLQLVS